VNCVAIILALLLGTFIGWLASLVFRSDSNERIIVDMLVGALGAIVLTISLGGSSTFDRFLAAFLGAFVAFTMLHLVRRSIPSRSDRGSG
jgi:uncharacterized membrane protein YeaQ/YmgE (transglycosylase-associated protein family)